MTDTVPAMTDLAFLALAIALFAISAAYVRGLLHLMDEPSLEEDAQ